MTTPHRCPVCEGSGNGPTITEHGPGSIFDEDHEVVVSYHVCPACKGTGVLWEPEEEPTVLISPLRSEPEPSIFPNPATTITTPDTTTLPRWELTCKEALRGSHKAGGCAWDAVEDPRALMTEIRGS